MTNYQNRSGNSPIKSFEIGPDFIIVVFKGSSEKYKYSHQSTGSFHVEKMKKLALNGIGLNSFILTTVKYNFEKSA